MHNHRIGVLIELETLPVFVTRTEAFHTLAHEICLQVIAIDPLRFDCDYELMLDADRHALEIDELLNDPFVEAPERSMRDRIHEIEEILSAPIKLNRLVRMESKPNYGNPDEQL